MFAAFEDATVSRSISLILSAVKLPDDLFDVFDAVDFDEDFDFF